MANIQANRQTDVPMTLSHNYYAVMRFKPSSLWFYDCSKNARNRINAC